MNTIRYSLDASGIATLTFDAPGSSVNTMTRAWQHDLAEAAGQLEQDKDRIKGVLLESAKSTFFAGAALAEVLTLKEADAGRCFGEIEALKSSFRRIETLGRPVAALLAGAALGGGWEVALVAHARFALDDAAIRFGTPEVTLGLIPGATGITKTVRKLGLIAAQPYLMEGKLFDPHEAAALGWVDGLGPDAHALKAQALAWIAAHPEAQQPWDRREYKMPGGAASSEKIAAALTIAPAMLLQKTRGLYPAPEAILETMVEGALVDYATATRIESRKLTRIMVGQVAKNMVTAFFFNLNALRGGPRWLANGPPWRPENAAADARGCFTTRVFGSFVLEGAAMLAEGIAAPLVEHAALAAGMAVGPLAALDDAALPSVLHMMEAMRTDPARAGTVAAPSDGERLIVRMAGECKRTGRAAGGGFYDYPPGEAPRLWPGLQAALAIRALVEADIAWLTRRYLYRQSIEAARCLAEGVVASVADANIGSIVGAGFPAWTGGAMQFIAAEGRDRFLAGAEALAARCGERFALADAVRGAIPSA